MVRRSQEGLEKLRPRERGASKRLRSTWEEQDSQMVALTL